MLRNPVVADRFRNSAVSDALRVHAKERSHLLAVLTDQFQRGTRIRAASLWGSFSRGEQDDLSDLDLWLLVTDDYVEEAGEFVKLCCERAGMVVFCKENSHNAPEAGRYLGILMAGTHGLHHLDFYWQPVSAYSLPEGPVLFDRIQDPTPTPLGPVWDPYPRKESTLEYCTGRIAFVWLMLSVAAKYLARDPSSDMSLITYPRPAFDETVIALNLQGQIDDSEWTPPTDPLDKVELVRAIARKTAVLENHCRLQGGDIAPEANDCLMRYFDLVEAILSDGVMSRVSSPSV